MSMMQFRIVALLVLSSVAGFAVSSAHGFLALNYLAMLVLSIVCAGAGAEVLNKMLEIDVDRMMERTKLRPSVTGQIDHSTGILIGILLAGIGVALGYLINPATALMVLLGILFYIVVYTKLLKKRTRFSVVVGGLAGSFCVWAGSTAASGTVNAPGFLLGLLVLSWIPGHIWSFALKYRKDYIRAKVPMLTAVSDIRAGSRAIAAANALMALLALYLSVYLGLYYALIVFIPLVATLWLSAMTVSDPKRAWALFKFSSVFLAFAFFAVIAAHFL